MFKYFILLPKRLKSHVSENARQAETQQKESLKRKNQNSQHSAATSLKSSFSEFLEPQHFAFSFIICLLRLSGRFILRFYCH